MLKSIAISLLVLGVHQLCHAENAPLSADISKDEFCKMSDDKIADNLLHGTAPELPSDLKKFGGTDGYQIKESGMLIDSGEDFMGYHVAVSFSQNQNYTHPSQVKSTSLNADLKTRKKATLTVVKTAKKMLDCKHFSDQENTNSRDGSVSEQNVKPVEGAATKKPNSGATHQSVDPK